MADFQIDGRIFRNQASYDAGLRDKKRIERIEEKAKDMTLEEKRELLAKMKEDAFRFESVLGSDYMDDFEEALVEAEQAAEKKSQRKSFLKGKTKNITEENSKGEGSKAVSDTGRANSAGNKTADKKDDVGKKTNDKKDKAGKKTKDRKNNKLKKLEDYDKEMQKIILEEMKKNDLKRRLIMFGTAFVGVACIGIFTIRMYIEQKNESIYEDLVAEKEEHESSGNSVNRKSQVHLSEEEDVELTILPEYENLYEKNPNLIGWVKIDDTNIDYPVLKSEDRSYYLTHGFDEEYDRNGCIFMDPDCDVVKRSTNIILYGHHMHTGKMFGTLDKYKDKTFYESHPLIEFDTIYEKGTYEVVYAFNSQVFYEDEITFKYYQFIDAVSEDAFYSNCEEMEKISIYDTGVRPVYGDQLLTLSTCDKTENEQGRFVVVARKID